MSSCCTAILGVSRNEGGHVVLCERVSPSVPPPMSLAFLKLLLSVDVYAFSSLFSSIWVFALGLFIVAEWLFSYSGKKRELFWAEFGIKAFSISNSHLARVLN